MAKAKAKPNKPIDDDKDLSGKVASIGEFATKSPDAELDPLEPGGEREEEGGGGESEIPEGDGKKIDGEILKERVLSIVSQVGSRGLGEAEAAAFVEEFGFWNGIMFEFLDMSGSLKSVLDNTQVKLSPMKATLIYAGGTLGLIALMRPDLVKKAIASVKSKKPSDSVVRAEPAATSPEQEVKTETAPAGGGTQAQPG